MKKAAKVRRISGKAGSPLLLHNARVCSELEFSSKLVPGRLCGLLYLDDRGLGSTWHERLLLFPADEKHRVWWIMTPDGEMYPEDVFCTDPSGADRAFVTNDARTFPSEFKGQFYRFRRYPTQGTFEEKVLKARQLTAGSLDSVKDPKWALNMGMVPERFDTMLGLEPARVPSTPKRAGRLPEGHNIATPGGDSPGDARSDGALVALPTAGEMEKEKVAANEAEYQWLAMETAHGIEIHTQVGWTNGSVGRGNRAVIWLCAGSATEGEKVICCYKSHSSSLEEDRPSFESTLAKDTTPPLTPRMPGGEQELELDDARIFLPLCYDTKGKRHLEFTVGLAKMTEESMADFPLLGERSLSWLFQYVRSNGGTFDSRHTKWVMEQNMEKESMSSIIHDILGSALEVSVTYDQLDSSNLACLELIGRLYQTIEETNGTLAIEGLHHYFGRDTGSGLRKGIALAPVLARHAVEQQSKETAILKERRKAREEKENEKGGAGQPGGTKPCKKE